MASPQPPAEPAAASCVATVSDVGIGNFQRQLLRTGTSFLCTDHQDGHRHHPTQVAERKGRTRYADGLEEINRSGLTFGFFPTGKDSARIGDRPAGSTRGISAGRTMPRRRGQRYFI